MSTQIYINIDVDNLERAIAFYRKVSNGDFEVWLDFANPLPVS